MSLFCRLWLVLKHPTFDMCLELSISKKSVIDWSSVCREVCQFWLEQRSEVLGGPGIVVEIDEAKIGHRKYNRGRWVEGFWIFGGYERGTGQTFLVLVPSRDSETKRLKVDKVVRMLQDSASDSNTSSDDSDESELEDEDLQSSEAESDVEESGDVGDTEAEPGTAPLYHMHYTNYTNKASTQCAFLHALVQATNFISCKIVRICYIINVI